MTDPTARRLFLRQYGQIRKAEGRGSDTSDYYRALPYMRPEEPLADQWRIRAKTFEFVTHNLLPTSGARILDLGAGNGWLSHRLREQGHSAVALDIYADDRDGLGAAVHYAQPLARVEADFNVLPFAEHSFDIVIFNASFHYSADYTRTLLETRRVLRRSGRVLILESPVYRRPESGERMRAERQRAFERSFGFRSEALRSIEFLDESTIRRLGQELRLSWKIYRPWYGISWHLRPLRAWIRRQRPPSRFWILEGRFS